MNNNGDEHVSSNGLSQRKKCQPLLPDIVSCDIESSDLWDNINK